MAAGLENHITAALVAATMVVGPKPISAGQAKKGQAPGKTTEKKDEKKAEKKDEKKAEEKGCLTCHKNPNMKKRYPNRSLTVDPKILKGSVHKELDCDTCHSDLGEAEAGKPHKTRVKAVDCSQCHEKVSKVYAQSVHAVARKNGKKEAAGCSSCHGTHDIYKVRDSRSRVAKLKLPFTCAKCHENPKLTRKYKIHRPKVVEHYVESLHGRALLKGGLLAAPSCTDCHGSHEIQTRENPRSKIHHSQAAQTCGRCHSGILKTFLGSVHGKLLTQKKGKNSNGAVCHSCHTAHQVVLHNERAFKMQIDKRCGSCHKDRLRRYRETYHGKAMALGRAGVAACHDCHGYHNVLPVSDPKSTLHKNQRLKTCRKCHPKAGVGFTTFMAHADAHDKTNYSRLYWVRVGMTVLLSGVLLFVFITTVLWLIRLVVEIIRDPKAFREKRRRVHAQGKLYVRFQPVDRLCHILLASSVLLLMATGMPLKFYYTRWARWIFGILGGVQVAGWLHRLAAAVLVTAFIIHLFHLVGKLREVYSESRDASGRFGVGAFFATLLGPDSPLPRLQDFRDFWGHMKWFLGLGLRPAFDRWTYWEKFDYLGVFWGIPVIGTTGFIMWFPEQATRVLPGWIVNIALVIHGDEALLAAGFLFTFHFFTTHIRPHKFPMDTAMFSGRITEEEMKIDRPSLYERLKAGGKLVEDPGKGAEWQDWKRVWIPVGASLFLAGVALAVVVYIAMARYFF